METVAVAHRAGNGLFALRQAEAAGAQLIEVDVHLFHSRLEARHLNTVGPLRLYWDRWEVRPPSTPIVAFEDLLASTNHPLLIDLKGGAGSLGGRVAEAVEGRVGTTWICSRRWGHLEPLRGRPGLAVVASVGSASQLARLLRRYGPGDLDGVSIATRRSTRRRRFGAKPLPHRNIARSLRSPTGRPAALIRAKAR